MNVSEPNIVLRTLKTEDIGAISEIHLRAFPDRAMSALGFEAVRRYYAWLLMDVHSNAYRIGAFDGDRLVGFNFAGRYNGALSGYLQRNRNFLMMKVAQRPWLLITNELFRSRVNTALNIIRFRRRVRTSKAAPDNEASVERVNYQRGFGILSIAVDPSVQGAGIGKKLMEDAQQEARRRGVGQMNLSVDVQNLQAISFYERIGWHKSLEADGVWRGSMIKALSPSTASETSTTPG